MFKKVLVADDLDSINIGVAKVLEKMGITDVHHALYCDEAYLKAKKALHHSVPMELLICDLSFKADHRNVKLALGPDLIKAIKEDQPGLKIIVFSVEDHPQTIKKLLDSHQIEGYVCKDRKGLTELTEAIREVYQGRSYISPQIAAMLNKKNLITLQGYEVALLTRLANGFTQDEIEEQFKKEGISPSSKSSIEKRLKELKEEFNANTTVHLITILKDLRLI